MDANAARQAAARSAVPQPDPADVKAALDNAHKAIANASNRGTNEVDVPLGILPEPILAAVTSRLRTEGYTVFRDAAARAITIHW